MPSAIVRHSEQPKGRRRIQSLRAFRQAESENGAEGKEERSYDVTKTLENRLEVYEHMSDLLSVI